MIACWKSSLTIAGMPSCCEVACARSAFSQKIHQSWNNPLLRCSSPAFPDHQCLPAGCSQRLQVAPISFHVSLSLVLPEFCVCFWGHFPIATAMHVPETAVYKDHFPVFRQHKIRLARQVFAMQSKAVAHLMNQTSDNHLRLRIFASNARHIERTLLSCMDVSHCAFRSWTASRSSQQRSHP